MPTDTEMLDWVINTMVDNPSDESASLLGGALLMGKTGRDAITMAMSGEVPPGVVAAALSLAPK